MNDMTQADFDSILPVAAEPETINIEEESMKASGVRQLADFVARFEKAGLTVYLGDTSFVFAYTKEEFQKACRVLGRFAKNADDKNFKARRELDGGIALEVNISREKICKRVQVGTKRVEEQVIPAVEAKVIPAHDEPVYKWECTPSVLEQSSGESITPPPAPAIAASDELPF